MSDTTMTPAAASASAPAGWYPDPETGESRYWDGQSWAALAEPQEGSDVADAELARQARRAGWWRLGFAMLIAVVTTGILMATVAGYSFLWYGGYIWSASLIFQAFRIFRSAGQHDRTGMGARRGGAVAGAAVALATAIVLGMGAFLGGGTSAEPFTQQTAVGTCWSATGEEQVVQVDCDADNAEYKVTDTATTPEGCDEAYLPLDDDAYGCLAEIPTA